MTEIVDRVCTKALKGSRIDLHELGNVYEVAKECLRRGFDEDRVLACTTAYVATVKRK